MLGKMMGDVGRLSANLSTINAKLDVQGEELECVQEQARDTKMIKRVAIAAVVLLVPLLIGGTVKSIQDSTRQQAIERTVTEHRAKHGHEGLQNDVTNIRINLQKVTTEQQAIRRELDTDLQRVQQTLNKIQREGVPRRR